MTPTTKMPVAAERLLKPNEAAEFLRLSLSWLEVEQPTFLGESHFSAPFFLKFRQNLLGHRLECISSRFDLLV